MGYDWYEEDFADFLLKYNLPAYDESYNIKQFYKLEKEKFLSDFDKMINLNQYRTHPSTFYDALKTAREDIESNFLMIEEILKYYDISDYKKSQEVFDAMMSNTKDSLLIRTINNTHGYNPQLYRIRSVSEHENLNNPNELFHIPFTKRHLITNERYSLAGTPCLYLATHLGIAWEECGFPSRFYYSEYKYNYLLSENNEWDYKNDWQFISFLSPQQVAHDFLVATNYPSDEWKTAFICNYLKTYPLILACSIVNLNSRAVFKQEYIIPQMLLQWVRRNTKKYRGIIYFSCIHNDDLRRINGYNIVVPAINFSENGFCKDIASKFTISPPVFCDNTLDSSKCDKIYQYKKELLEQLNKFPFESTNCMIAIYDYCNIFDNLICRVEKTDMKLVVEMLKSISMNHQYIRSTYIKEKIIEESIKNSHKADIKARIELFEKFYSLFCNEIQPLISEYTFEIEKITTPQSKEFHSIK